MDTEPDHVLEGWHAVVLGPPRSNPEWEVELRPSRYTEFRWSDPELDGLPGFHLDLGDRDTYLPVEQVVRTGPDSFSAVTIPSGRSLEIRPFEENDALLAFAHDPDRAVPWPVPELIAWCEDPIDRMPRLSVVYRADGPSLSYAVQDTVRGQVIVFVFRGMLGVYGRVEFHWQKLNLVDDDPAEGWGFLCREVSVGAEAFWQFERGDEALPYVWEVPLLDGSYLDKDDFDDEWKFLLDTDDLDD